MSSYHSLPKKGKLQQVMVQTEGCSFVCAYRPHKQAALPSLWHCLVPPSSEVGLGGPRQAQLLAPWGLLKEKCDHFVECRKIHFSWPGSEMQTVPRRKLFLSIGKKLRLGMVTSG